MKIVTVLGLSVAAAVEIAPMLEGKKGGEMNTVSNNYLLLKPNIGLNMLRVYILDG